MSKIIWAIIILGILGGAAYFWLNPGSSTDSLISDSVFANLTKLKKIKLDTSFFSDAEFSGLQEVPRVNISGIQKGRTNPFAAQGKF